jgi:MFS family permease
VNRNVRTVLFVSILFGGATGIYEFIFPYYLKEQGLSFESMGVIFTVGAAGMLLVRILMGRLADVWGRRPFYGLAFGGSAVVAWLTPMSVSVVGQSVLKTLREAFFLTRETLHPVILYEESRGRFMAYMGRTRGFEFLFQGAGTLVTGLTLATLGTGGNLRLAGYLLAAGFVVFWAFFRESPPEAHLHTQSGGLRQLFSFDMHWNLKVITVSTFIFNVGLTTSHNFFMPLFFSEKFGVTPETVSWVMIGHRLTIALPLLIAGTLPIRRLKRVYIWTLAIEGAILSASSVIPGFYGSAGVWLLHDLVGAGIWIPIQNQIIQDYTDPDNRALQMGKLLAFGGVGTIIGPFLAGRLSTWTTQPRFEGGILYASGPFLVSGALISLAAVVLAWLRLQQPMRQRPTTPTA